MSTIMTVIKKIVFAVGVFYTTMIIIGLIAMACGYQPQP